MIAAAQQALGPLGLRDGLGPLHLRHRRDPQGAGGPARRLPRHRGHDPLRLLLRRQRRPVRDPARTGGRGDLRRAQPRQHHRRRPAVQGPAATATRNRDMADLEAQLQAGAGRAVPADRHRRRVLDGRLRRAAGRDLSTWPSATTRWSWSTTRTRSASSGRPAPVRRSCSACRTGWTSSPAPWARRSAGRAAATPRRARRSSRCCASAPGRTCSPTRVAALDRGRGIADLGSAGQLGRAADSSCGTTRPTSARR